MKRPRDLDLLVLRGLQALIVAVPLVRGGRSAWAIALGWPVVVALLALTIHQRRERGARVAPGVGALAGFVGLALATTVPLPPLLLGLLSPATARLTADMLPGWPDGGGWTRWRPLALDPYGVTAEIGSLALGLGVFAVVVAYPWRAGEAEGDAHARVFGRLLLTLVATGLLVAVLGLAQQAAGELPLAGTEALGGRASGPFVNANHFAAWLELAIPVTIAYLVALARRVRRRLARAADAGRGIGVRAGRAWISALVVHQRRLWAPLVTLAAVMVMGAAHVASGSRAGSAALLAGLAVAGAGVAATGRRGRAVPAAVALALALAGAGSVALWVRAESEAPAIDALDPSLGSRLAVAARGSAIVRDHPLVGTGLGSWLHAFRPYQQPPVEGGIWDHAHDDYLELAAETGVAGVALALLFALGVVRAARQRGGETAVAHRDRPPAFEVPEWREAMGERDLLRWGLAGGAVAVLAHSTLDFGLRMPANLLGLMVILGLLVLSGAPRATGQAPVGALLALLVLAALPPLADAVLGAAGAPRAPGRCLASADLVLAETGDTERALGLVRRALDRSPADREAHEMLARVLGAGPAGDAALERAIALNPWSTELRDRLAFRLAARGERAAAAAALEESMRRNPTLVAHAFLGPDGALPEDASELARVVVEGDSLPVRLAALDPEMAGAIERGLGRALDDVPAGQQRAAVVDDLVALLEARARWGDAAATLAAEADPGAGGATRLAHAARDQVRAGDQAAAERSLLAALLRTPERGELYRALAVDVYGARREFDTAERVLRAGERSAVDILPVYDGVTQLLAQREAARFEGILAPALEP